MGESLLSVDKVQERLGIKRTQVFKLMASGELRSVLVGRLRRVPESCLDEYIETLKLRPYQRSPGGGAGHNQRGGRDWEG